MIGRILIDDVRPRTPDRGHPAKAVIGESVTVSADIFRDGHDVLGARVRWHPAQESKWLEVAMRHVGNDRWEATIEPTALGLHAFVVQGWTDRFATWRHDVVLKHEAGQDVVLELEEGARILSGRAARVAKGERQLVTAAVAALRDESLPVESRLQAALDRSVVHVVGALPEKADLTSSRPFKLWVDRERALVGAWYELFPRSEGGLATTAKHRLPAVAAMGFDVVYVPPVHPIGHSHRKGRNNTLHAGPGDPGSPWAIGSEAGGHTAVDPGLGTLDDFDGFVRRARELGMEIALDYALQCSPDHPWVKEHPEWFHHRPDGSIRYAENPPKKYQDIYPINFWPATETDRVALWEACREIVEFWIGHGVRIFRVDNPHTKPVAFWEWMIPLIQADHPDVVFLAEAFTRPKMMAKLAEVGFSQSYTYFTWRTAKWELIDYLQEISHGPKADYMRPSFWPNTPDILAGRLRRGPRAAFEQRLILAATMVPTYGIYSGYELLENEPASDTNEEYLYSEKYEIKSRDWDAPHSLAPLVTRLNDIRRRHPALASLRTIRFHNSRNENVLAYSKHTPDRSDVVLVVVNLDPVRAHEDTLDLDLGFLGLPWDAPFEARDEMTGELYRWHGPNPYIWLDPVTRPAHILHLRP
ncbi:MAG: alpha-1,4-glucan--maltose-1-phosphate maltosyltransferase [Actinomycetota bacterium]|nr:alpha-1,4-glucan--maltose-1-phosphate maltosyltransferase [Actinomycetota bacterium]